MLESDIRTKIKEIISNVSSIPVEEIGDEASYEEDLALDSLTLLEIGVDMDYEFKLGLPEEQLSEIRTVSDAVAIVLEHRGEAAERAA